MLMNNGTPHVKALSRHPKMENKNEATPVYLYAKKEVIFYTSNV
jgi:hypothetical protein